MKIVVTGGAGFIGSNLCDALLRGGVREVVAIDDLSTGSATNLADGPVTLLTGSVLDPDLLAEALAGADGVIHLAALPSVPRSIRDPIASHQVNATGTVHVLDACRRVGAYVVVVSSSSVYGADPRLPKSEDLAPRPMSPYAASKLAAESYGLAYQHTYGLPTLAVRLFNVFGPRQRVDSPYAAIIPRLIDATLRGGPVEIHGDGRQTRDFTFVRSVTDVLRDAACRRVVHDRPVNLAFGTRTSLLSIVEALYDLTGRRPELVYAAARPGDVRHSQADPGTLRTLFPGATPHELRSALAETINWLAGTDPPRADPRADPPVPRDPDGFVNGRGERSTA